MYYSKKGNTFLIINALIRPLGHCENNYLKFWFIFLQRENMILYLISLQKYKTEYLSLSLIQIQMNTNNQKIKNC